MASARLAEALGALSFATDLAAGQPQGTALGATILAVRLGRSFGLGEDALGTLFYATITRRIGCTSTATEMAPMALGDERAGNLALNLADLTDPPTIRRHLEARLPAAGTETRSGAISAVSAMGDSLFFAADAHCRQAVLLTERLPVPPGVSALLREIDARWDGRNPIRSAGRDIPLGTRIMEFAAIAELHRRACGMASALEIAAARAGTQFDPEIASHFRAHHGTLTARRGQTGDWTAFLDSEPAPGIVIDPHRLRAVAFAYADFADRKSRHFLGHSRRVAALAFAAAVEAGLDEAACQAVFDAGLVHDIGRCAVPTGIWERAGPLDPLETGQIESHSYHTERILSIGSVFAGIAGPASSAHERCDGSGYHRRAKLADRAACLLAAANLYDELTHASAARSAMPPDRAAAALSDEARAGRLPQDAVRAVLSAAGHRASAVPALPAGLTPRETEMLVLVARGQPGKEIARTLGIAPKTVDKHTENIFRKIGVRSRTEAALFAMENGLFAR